MIDERIINYQQKKLYFILSSAQTQLGIDVGLQVGVGTYIVVRR